MVEQQDTFVHDTPEPKKGERVSKPDDGLCCLCRQPRPEDHRYLCADCTAESVARALKGGSW